MTISRRRYFMGSLYALPLGMLLFSAKRADAAAAGARPSGQALLDELAARQAQTDARQQITDVLYRYARGWDRLDEQALRSCFFQDADHQHGAFRGKSQDFITGGLAAIRAKVKSTSHLVTNPMIEIRGDKAVSECLFLAHHRRMNKDGSDEEDYFLKGRYLDRFEQRNGEWKIAFRRGLHDFERVVPRADVTLAAAPADQLSARKPDDPLYAMLADLHGG